MLVPPWPGLEVIGNVVDRPTPKPPARLIGDVGRKPAPQCTALQSLAGFVAAENGLRCVAETAMAETLGEIGAAIPLRAFVRIRHKGPGREVELIPNPHGHPDVERKR